MIHQWFSIWFKFYHVNAVTLTVYLVFITAVMIFYLKFQKSKDKYPIFNKQIRDF